MCRDRIRLDTEVRTGDPDTSIVAGGGGPELLGLDLGAYSKV